MPERMKEKNMQKGNGKAQSPGKDRFNFEKILSSLADIISVIDKDLNIIWANDAIRKRYGQDVIGKKCYTIFHKSIA